MYINTVISTNTIGLNAYRNLSSINQLKHINRLSSGLRINTASDDAAGSGISQKLKAQIRGIDRAVKNSEDAVSVIETVDSVYGEIQEMLQRCREISVQAANDTNTKEDKSKLMGEVVEILDEIEDVFDRAEFNGQSINEIINGMIFQVGSNSAQHIDFYLDNSLDLSFNIYDSLIEKEVNYYIENVILENIESLQNIQISGTVSGRVGTTILFQNKNGGQTDFNIADVSSYVNAIYESINYLGTYTELYEDLDYLMNSLETAIEEAVASAIEGTLNEYGYYTNSTIVSVSNQGDEAIFDTTNVTSEELNSLMNNPGDMVIVRRVEAKELSTNLTKAVQNFLNGFERLGEAVFTTSIKSHIESFINSDIDYNNDIFDLYIESFDDYIDQVSDIRAKLGATQNRIEYTINNLEVSNENLSSANSLIEDADMAEELMELTKTNVLVNAAMLVIAQSNSYQESVLKLLS